jgi:hypothetical protein
MEIIERGFREDFGQRYRTGRFCIGSDKGGDDECVQAPGHPPACSFGDRTRVTFGRADQIGYRQRRDI